MRVLCICPRTCFLNIRFDVTALLDVVDDDVQGSKSVAVDQLLDGVSIEATTTLDKETPSVYAADSEVVAQNIETSLDITVR